MAQGNAELAALLRTVTAQLDRGALDAAAAACTRALALAPRNPDALHALAVTEFRRGRAAPAMAAVERALAIAPGHARAQAFKGAMLLAARRFGEAAKPLRRATQLAPDSADAFMHLGLAIDGSGGKPDEAIAALERAARLAPQSADAHYNLGNVLRRHGRLDAAAAAFRSACARDSLVLEAWNNLGLTLRDLGDRAGAQAAWRDGLSFAVGSDRTAALLWSNLGNLLDRADELKERLEAHRRAVALAPDEPRLHLNYGIALQEAGNEGLAWIQFGRAYDVDPVFVEQHAPETGFYRAGDEVRLLDFRRRENDKLIAAAGTAETAR